MVNGEESEALTAKMATEMAPGRPRARLPVRPGLRARLPEAWIRSALDLLAGDSMPMQLATGGSPPWMLAATLAYTSFFLSFLEAPHPMSWQASAGRPRVDDLSGDAQILGTLLNGESAVVHVQFLLAGTWGPVSA